MGGKIMGLRVETRRGVIHVRAMSKNARGTSYTLRGVAAGPVGLDRATTKRNLKAAIDKLLPVVPVSSS